MENLTLRDWLEEGPYTLALSSSFFGFYAHCGVAMRLFEGAPRPRKITGSSAGALVGGALASGLSPKEARDLLFSVKKSDFWDPFPGLGLLRGGKFLKILQENFVGSFSETKLPLEVAALDVLSLRTRFLSEGSLPKAVVASCAVPVLFHPVRIGKKFYLDGGVFHKSGINLENSEERLLSIFLLNDGLADSYEWGRSLGNLGTNQKVLRLKNLPRVDYNSLEKGTLAFSEAYRRCGEALKASARTDLIDG